MESDDKLLWEAVVAKTNEQIDRRDDLIEQLLRGEISPDRAVSKAKQLGLSPLYGDTDPSIFDPMSEISWTPLMAVAWIAFRDVHIVRRSADEYRFKCTHLVSIGKGRYRIVPLGNATLLSLQTRAARRRLEPDAINGAHRGLVRALEQGKLESSGIVAALSGRTQIPRLQWLDLRLFGKRDEQDSAVGAGIVWQCIRFPQSTVVKLWEPNVPRAETSNEKKRRVVNEAIEHFGISLLKAQRQKERESNIMDWAKEHHKLTVSPRFVRDIWLKARVP
jgi:hypothetical protein